MQRGSPDSEEPSCLRLVSVGALDRELDGLLAFSEPRAARTPSDRIPSKVIDEELHTEDGRSIDVDQESPDNAVQLADIVGPWIRHECREEVWGDCRRRAIVAETWSVRRDQPSYQWRNVLGPFAERRDDDTEGTEPREEVAKHAAGVDQTLQGLACGEDDPHIHRHVDVGSQRPKRSMFDGAEQPPLIGKRALADLIQKQRPAVRHCKRSLSLPVGPGECARQMAEQLRAREVVIELGHADGLEGSIGARRQCVDAGREPALPRPGFALEHDWLIGSGEAKDALSSTLEGATRRCELVLEGSDQGLAMSVGAI
jgi:hypothetical protein